MSQPKLSLIICTYNRAYFLDSTLRSLGNQFSNLDYEVIVVDNNSSDQTKEVVSTHSTILGSKLRYEFENIQGLSAARNRGISSSASDILSFIDDDVIVPCHFVDTVYYFFNRTSQAAASGGPVIPYFTEGMPSWYGFLTKKLVSAIDFGSSIKELKKKYPFGANMSFRRSCFDTVGVFNNDLGRKGAGMLGGEEADMFKRIRNAGLKVYYDPSQALQHIIPPERLTEEALKKFSFGVGVSQALMDREATSNKYPLIQLRRNVAPIVELLFALLGRKAEGSMMRKVAEWIDEGYSSTTSQA